MGPASQVHEAMGLCDSVIDGVAIGHEHAALAHPGVQNLGGRRAARGRVTEQPDGWPRSLHPGARRHLHPHVALGLRAFAGFFQHLHMGFVAMDEGRVQQMVAHQVDDGLHLPAHAHDAGGQGVA